MKGTRLVDITKEINTLLTYKSYNILNSMLAKAYANIPNMSTDKILTYVKAVQPGKAELKVWKHFIQSVKLELNKREVNVDEALKDLI